jgi:hypothetical protein
MVPTESTVRIVGGLHDVIVGTNEVEATPGSRTVDPGATIFTPNRLKNVVSRPDRLCERRGPATASQDS